MSGAFNALKASCGNNYVQYITADDTTTTGRECLESEISLNDFNSEGD